MKRNNTIRVLLICGILSPILYAVADLTAGMLWQGYSFKDQTISELGAIGAPYRLIFSSLLVVVYALFTAFGVGVWNVTDGNRRLHITGALFVVLGVMALTVGIFVPMQLRGTEQGLFGALHLIEGTVAMLMIFTAMGFAATAFGTRFRLYTILTMIIAFSFGAWSGMDAPLIEQGLATPWVGIKERIFWYAYQSWYIVLAVLLLHSGIHNGTNQNKTAQIKRRSLVK